VSCAQVEPVGAVRSEWSGPAHSLPAASCGQTADARTGGSPATPVAVQKNAFI